MHSVHDVNSLFFLLFRFFVLILLEKVLNPISLRKPLYRCTMAWIILPSQKPQPTFYLQLSFIHCYEGILFSMEIRLLRLFGSTLGLTRIIDTTTIDTTDLL